MSTEGQERGRHGYLKGKSQEELAETARKAKETIHNRPEKPPTEKVKAIYARGVARMEAAVEAVKSGRLRVDEEGRVWRGSDRADRLHRDGYFYVSAAWKNVIVHRLVWTLTNGTIPLGMQINHIDGDKENNHLSNLEVVTDSGNKRHAHRVLGAPKPPRHVGETHHNAKLNPEKVREARKLLAEGWSQRKVAGRLEVSQYAIFSLAAGRTWREVE